jgi:hypothetical protein
MKNTEKLKWHKSNVISRHFDRIETADLAIMTNEHCVYFTRNCGISGYVWLIITGLKCKITKCRNSSEVIKILSLINSITVRKHKGTGKVMRAQAL